jgi:hypothetical protein
VKTEARMNAFTFYKTAEIEVLRKRFWLLASGFWLLYFRLTSVFKMYMVSAVSVGNVSDSLNHN